uniref:Uncharacterized protein n=1 Tax=Arundo donax TaxID=35708 RepID=A0A0A8XX82_ARUDO
MTIHSRNRVLQLLIHTLERKFSMFF